MITRPIPHLFRLQCGHCGLISTRCETFVTCQRFVVTSRLLGAHVATIVDTRDARDELARQIGSKPCPSCRLVWSLQKGNPVDAAIDAACRGM